MPETEAAANSETTARLLARHAEGDERALPELVVRHLDWLQEQVHHRLGPALRRKAETGDFVQEALVGFLRYGPKVVIESEQQLKRLLLIVVEHTICDRHGYFTAKRRDMAREATLSPDSVVLLDSDRAPAPSEAAVRGEVEAEVRLALELLSPEDREIVVRRMWDQQSYDAIAEAVDSTPDAVRMRFRRALAQLSKRLVRLRHGEI